jgi:hypothetical protein
MFLISVMSMLAFSSWMSLAIVMSMMFFMTKAVLGIRIRKDPYNFSGSGSVSHSNGTKKLKGRKGKFNKEWRYLLCESCWTY